MGAFGWGTLLKVHSYRVFFIVLCVGHRSSIQLCSQVGIFKTTGSKKVPNAEKWMWGNANNKFVRSGKVLQFYSENSVYVLSLCGERTLLKVHLAQRESPNLCIPNAKSRTVCVGCGQRLAHWRAVWRHPGAHCWRINTHVIARHCSIARNSGVFMGQKSQALHRT